MLVKSNMRFQFCSFRPQQVGTEMKYQ